MVLSYYLLKPFYSAWWRLLNLFVRRSETVFYCHTPVDMQNWLPVQKHLRQIPIVSDKKTTRRELQKQGFMVRSLPVFPKAVIMCRVSAHKFPSRKVIKIGMNHGAYHFKRFTSAKHYAPFRLFLFSSQSDLKNARNNGVTCGEVGGYPKLDPYLNKVDSDHASKNRPRLLFTATYDSSGMSAVDQWIDLLPDLSRDFEVTVSLHPWMSASYKSRLMAMPGISYIGTDALPYIARADVCVVDTSSIIADCCAMNKALISWKLPDSNRTVSEITEFLDKASIRISDAAQLKPAIERALAHPDEFAAERARANRVFFDSLDGNAGLRSAAQILRILPELAQ